MKKTLLLFLLLLPFFGISQTDLVKWNALNGASSATSKTPQVLSSDVVSGDIKVSTTDISFDYNNSWQGSPFFNTGGWPSSNTYNPDRYLEFKIAPTANHKIDLSRFSITHKSQGNTVKFLLRYAIDPTSNSDFKNLTSEIISTTSYTKTIVPFPSDVSSLLEGKTLYIRLYAYGAYDAFHIKTGNGNGATDSPVIITGTPSVYNPALTAVNDNATSIKNNFTFINVISNDVLYSNSRPITSVTVSSQPTNSGGTAVVNPVDKTIKFTAATGFTGATSFNYTIGDGTSTSAATVYVNVLEPPVPTDLVKWSRSDAVPTIYAPTNTVSAGNLTKSQYTTLDLLPNEGFKAYPWPTQFSIDESKYLELTTSAESGYKIKLDKFNFTYSPDPNNFIARYQVRYSKDNFTTSFLLVDEPTSPGKNNKSLDLSAVTLYPNEKITIRIYAYKLKSREFADSPIFLFNDITKGSGTVPTITGTVLNYDATDLNANDDLVSTQEKRAVAFNPLANDTNTSGTTISYTQPASSAGTVSLNGSVFTFTPATNFKGTSSFTYTLTKGTQTSMATVTIYVTELSPKLIIWNGILQSAKAVVTDPNITGNDLTVGGNGVNLRLDKNEFYVTGLQNNGATAENLNRYIQVNVTPNQKYNLTLTQFKFTYNSPGNEGAAMFQVRYSKDPNFADNGTILLGPTVAVKNADKEITMDFPSGTRVLSSKNETFYIRIYPYAVSDLYNGYFVLKNSDGGETGPTITGVVEPSNLITANADFATVSSSAATPIAILANDENYTPLASITTTQPTVGGTVQVNGTTNVTFTPTPGYTGTSTFEYTIFNGLNYSTATVTLNVKCEAPGNQTDFGSNQWIGYVYKLTTNTNPPNITNAALPNSSIATYIGRVTENKNFDRDMGNGAVSGLTTEIPCETAPTDRFYIRYKMRAEITEAGNYRFDLGSDDGIRLYIDGTEVLARWGNRGYANDSYTQNLATGTHEFVLEYYEDGGAARNSFFLGLPKGNPADYGDKVWNVYGYVNNDITLTNVRYAGYYVDPNPNPYSTSYWTKDKSPSSATIWQGTNIPDNNFTVVFKRKGFECGRYALQHVNHDDAIQIYIDDVLIFEATNWNNASFPINSGTLYALNSESRVEIRLREDGGDANMGINFTKTNVNYTNGLGNESGSNLVVNSSQTLSADLKVCSCTVNPNYTLTVPKDVTLTVDENINVGAGGKLLILSGGSLLQTSTSTSMFTGGSNAFEIQRTTSVRRYDLTYWSLPVTNADFTMYTLSPLTLADKYFYLDTNIGDWAIFYGGKKKMLTGIGYNIRAPQTFDITTKADFTAKFEGVPNNGNISTNVAAGGWNLIGNPYPSAIDADTFRRDNPGIGTLYFWAHVNLPVSNGLDKYYYYMDDFIAYNGLGSNGDFDGSIATAQGFLVEPAAGTIYFNNGQREKGNNKQFFKTDQSSVEKHRIWLNFGDKSGSSRRILVGYAQGATNSTDTEFDAMSMESDGLIDFYSINNSKKLVIQGRALPFDKSDLVPFGYMVNTKGDYTFSIDHADGIFNENQEVFLEDKTTGKITNLRLANYTFNSAAGTFNNRFVLRYTNSTLGTDDFENVENGVVVSVKSKIVNVKSSAENISEVQIYNIAGQTLYTKNKIDSKDLQISNLQSGNQVLLVKITLENGATVTKKIIFN